MEMEMGVMSKKTPYKTLSAHSAQVLLINETFQRALDHQMVQSLRKNTTQKPHVKLSH